VVNNSRSLLLEFSDVSGDKVCSSRPHLLAIGILAAAVKCSSILRQSFIAQHLPAAHLPRTNIR